MLDPHYKWTGRPWKGEDIQVDENFLKDALVKKIEFLNWDDVKEDVRKFLPKEKAQSLDIWSADFFKSKVKKMNFGDCN